jgi:uncharacterized membrane protein YbhN (UPF0104 family)
MQWYRRLKQALRDPRLIPVLNLATLLFGLFLIVVIGWRNRDTLDQPWLFDFRMIGLGLVFFSLNLVAVVYGWAKLVDQFSGQPLSYRQHLRVYASTNLSKRLPGALWYIAGRAVQYERLAISPKITSLTSLLEYLLLIISGVTASLLLFPFMVSSLNVSWPFLVLSIGLGLVLIHPRIIQQILIWLRQPADVPLNYWHLLRSLSWYVFGWLLGGLMFYGIIRFLHPLPLSLLPSVVGFWSISSSVALLAFFSPSGLGIKEVSLSVLLASHVPSPTAISIAILARFVLILFEFLWTLVVVDLHWRGSKSQESPKSSE